MADIERNQGHSAMELLFAGGPVLEVKFSEAIAHGNAMKTLGN